MGAELTSDWRTTLSSALEWWSDAGVDMLAADDPRDWLAPPVTAKRADTPQVAVAEPVEEKLPDTLDAFVEYRMGGTAPEAGWMSPRIAPQGSPGAGLMILADMPEGGEPDTLIGGSAGRLFDKMLAAIGESRESVYVTALAWAPPIAGSVSGAEEAQLIRLALHHIGLISPAKLLLVGQAATRVLSATNEQPAWSGSHDIKHFGGNTVAVAIRHPRFLLTTPGAKANAWRQLLLLSGGTSL